MQLEVSVLSNPGGRERNEDACGFWTGDGGCFCVVSDGAGGHGGGDVASKLAVRMILTAFQESPECTGAAIDRRAQAAAHRAIVDAAGDAGDRCPACARPPRCSPSTPCTTPPCGATSATRGCTASATAASSRRPRTTASCRRWSTPATSRRPRIRESLQRSRLFAALGHDEDFERDGRAHAVSARRRRRVPAVHRRLLGIRRRAAMIAALAQRGDAGRAGCATWSATSCERGGASRTTSRRSPSGAARRRAAGRRPGSWRSPPGRPMVVRGTLTAVIDFAR